MLKSLPTVTQCKTGQVKKNHKFVWDVMKSSAYFEFLSFFWYYSWVPLYFFGTIHGFYCPIQLVFNLFFFLHFQQKNLRFN